MCTGGVSGVGFLVSEKSEALKVKDISALTVLGSSFPIGKLVWTMNKCSFGMALPDNAARINAITKKELKSVYVNDFYPV